MRTDLAEELRLLLRGRVRRHDVHGGAATSAKGFRPGQVMAIALDPRCKMFYGFPENEHNDVWGAVTQAAADIL